MRDPAAIRRSFSAGVLFVIGVTVLIYAVAFAVGAYLFVSMEPGLGRITPTVLYLLVSAAAGPGLGFGLLWVVPAHRYALAGCYAMAAGLAIVAWFFVASLS